MVSKAPIPGLAEMRRKIAMNLDAMGEAAGAEKPFMPVGPEAFVNTGLLAHPRFGEYAGNTVAAHEEMQAALAALVR